MKITDILKLVFTALGGVTFIVAVLKFLAEKIADRINKKYEAKLDKELKDYETELDRNMEIFRLKVDNKKYVTQYRFNQEFDILRKIYSEYFDFTYLTWDVIQSVTRTDETFDFKIKEYKEKCDEFTKYFYRNNVFINTDLSAILESGIKELNTFRNLSSYVRDQFKQCLKANALDSDAYITHVENNLKELSSIHDELNVGTAYGLKAVEQKMRTYLESLEVIE